jgi:ABC-type Fe3+/spermidine/putrescine transport system ATPase subunit
VENESFLVLESINKSFGSVQVLRDIDLTVARGEVLALLGPSGSGKTTLLRLLAGFESPDAGRILLQGKDVARRPPERRGFGMVFQHYALFPHLTVAENVAFGLQSQKGWDKARIRRRVEEMLTLVDLAGYGDRRPTEISGGQQQRVALARALAPDPRLLLLDEPLSNLDPSLRERTRRQLRETVGRVGITTVLVTHEQEEAFHLGDRVAVLHDGILQQVGKPEDLYHRPATHFTAGFIGRAAALPGRVETVEDGTVGLRLGERDEGPLWTGTAVDSPVVGARAELVVRPEALQLKPADDGSGLVGLSGKVLERRYAGLVTYYQVQLSGPLAGVEVEVLAPVDAARPGDAVGITLRPDGPAPRVFGVNSGTGAAET